jgi:predicted DNA-binding transcriptional regulator AlpA
MATTTTAGDAASIHDTAQAVPESLKQFDSLPDSAHVQARTVAAVLGLSEATIWRMVKRGKLPAPKKVSERATRWNVGELRRAMAV